ncbi:uncharacterized protein BDZ99DRAFT_497844 [Mytilinidion resinicola]|uniref:Uncharacterized protein n=1 Tax=Mytilinidion resinicola TaxID=574789 RepID=A0A6A6YPU3_9PEZI|nr:uncharacterized protein BDZ99DRAFT_497844 [Mytilinidion resinicola]KAF2810916.1 hypothetical protein BDZ99DRAFT_497844 [Mytilinidion resinicola]
MKYFSRAILFLLPVLSSTAEAASNASNICSTFVAKNSTAKSYHISFYDNGNGPSGNPFQNVTFPANATASSPWKIVSPSHHNKSAPFTLTNCTFTTQSSCTHGGCYINYITTTQITHSKRCLTFSTTDATQNATFSFQPCNGANATAQLFELSQVVNYSPGYASITAYGEVDVNLIQLQVATQPFRAFWIGDEGSSERRTIEAILYPYTQAGVGVKLI